MKQTDPARFDQMPAGSGDGPQITSRPGQPLVEQAGQSFDGRYMFAQPTRVQSSGVTNQPKLLTAPGQSPPGYAMTGTSDVVSSNFSQASNVAGVSMFQNPPVAPGSINPQQTGALKGLFGILGY